VRGGVGAHGRERLGRLLIEKPELPGGQDGQLLPADYLVDPAAPAAGVQGVEEQVALALQARRWRPSSWCKMRCS